MQNLPQLQKEVEKEKRLHNAFLARLDAQKMLEDKDRERQQYYAVRQKALIESDLIRKRQGRETIVKKKVIAKGLSRYASGASGQR